MKKIIAAVIVLSMLIVCVSPAFAAVKMPAPVVYVAGQTAYIYSDKNDIDSELYITNTLPEGLLEDTMNDLTRPLVKGLGTGNWDEYCDVLYNALAPVFSEIALDKNGEPKNDTGYDCVKDTEPTDRAVNGRYSLYDYRFIYDWRLDPCATADELNDYIIAVKAATGASKVNLACRGLGYSIVLAYLAEYGCDDVNELALYNVGLGGVDVCGAMFSGRLELDGDALVRFIETTDTDNVLLNFVKGSIGYLNSNGALADPLKITERVYGKIYEKVLPRLLRENFGTMPGYWSLVGDEYYEDAIALNFGDEESAEQYGGLIEKLNNFHYGVFDNARAILDSALENGVHIYNIVKYGKQLVPVTENSAAQSDRLVSLYNQTWGATAADYGEDALSDEYLADLADNGTLDFVSPDACIDASTGFIPEHTWFIKNLDHDEMPECADALMAAAFNFNGYLTVFDFEDYPQYLFCSKEKTELHPLNGEGGSDYEESDLLFDWRENLTFTGVIQFFRDLILNITKAIIMIIRASQGITAQIESEVEVETETLAG